jgi:hypothetical protein
MSNTGSLQATLWFIMWLWWHGGYIIYSLLIGIYTYNPVLFNKQIHYFTTVYFMKNLCEPTIAAFTSISIKMKNLYPRVIIVFPQSNTPVSSNQHSLNLPIFMAGVKTRSCSMNSVHCTKLRVLLLSSESLSLNILVLMRRAEGRDFPRNGLRGSWIPVKCKRYGFKRLPHHIECFRNLLTVR